MANLWGSIGINYLTFDWPTDGTEIILDENDIVMKQVYPYIDNCLQDSESILVHSVTGMNRSVMIIAAFLMIKYSWGLKKSLEFIKTRKPNLEIKSNILEQLVHYEAHLMTNVIKNPSQYWHGDCYDNKKVTHCLDTVHNLENEEYMLRNTYLNSLVAQKAHFNTRKDSSKIKHKKTNNNVQWLDKGKGVKEQLEILNQSQDLINKEKVSPVTTHVDIEYSSLKPIIKDSQSKFRRTNEKAPYAVS